MSDYQPASTPGPCARCGQDPAEGFASIWTAATGERWYCHGDDGPSCYAPTEAALDLSASTSRTYDLAEHVWLDSADESFGPEAVR